MDIFKSLFKHIKNMFEYEHNKSHNAYNKSCDDIEKMYTMYFKQKWQYFWATHPIENYKSNQ